MTVANDTPDELLMAYADGEASVDEAARVEAAVERDAALADRLAMFMETRGLADAFPLGPVPADLRTNVEAMIAGGAGQSPDGAGPADRAAPAENVVPLRPQAGRPKMPHWAMAVAASVLGLAIGIGAFFATGEMAGRESADATTPATSGVARLAALPLAQAMAIPSGDEQEIAGQRVRTISTFRNGAGALCREFEAAAADLVTGVACHANGAWSVDFALAEPLPSDDYVPASGTELLDAYLATIEAGPPLDPSEEGEALGKAD
ncbi:anti-sigma factor [Acuticoccus sp. M5D2P5]|uniref:anti-sigma factor family protein n=1 Tax=Acuticoccus kalidii TaxID=2910977 RepID=UPI001F2A1948|nr:anti-sigma factor [Acuticoccus kalidii]MCF3932539.1 anti-sigma factor [Acuticoccus kalidii]